MSVYAVIDTNVIVSAMISRHSDSSTVLLIQRTLAGEVIPVFNNDIMKEYAEVLSRKKFKIERWRIGYILSAFYRFGLLLEPSPTGEILTDIKDLPFYEVAMEKRKTDDAYLVTENQKHFSVRPFIVSPNEMLDILDEKQSV